MARHGLNAHDRGVVPRRIAPHARQLAVQPGRRVVVADVVRHVAPRHDPALRVQQAAGGQTFPRRFRILRIPVRQRVVLKERRVGHRAQTQGVPIHVGVEAGEDFGVPPLGWHFRMTAAGTVEMRVLVRPRHETGDVDHSLAPKPLIGRVQQFLQRGHVRAGRLGRIVDTRFVIPHVQVEEHAPPGDHEIVVRKRVVGRAGSTPALMPIGVQVVAHDLRVGLARLHVVFDQPPIGIVLRAAGRVPLRSGDLAPTGEQRRPVVLQQADLHLQPPGLRQLSVQRAVSRIKPQRQQVVAARDRRGQIRGGRNPFVPDDRAPVGILETIKQLLNRTELDHRPPRQPAVGLRHLFPPEVIRRGNVTQEQPRRRAVRQPLKGHGQMRLVPEPPPGRVVLQVQREERRQIAVDDRLRGQSIRLASHDGRWRYNQQQPQQRLGGSPSHASYLLGFRADRCEVPLSGTNACLMRITGLSIPESRRTNRPGVGPRSARPWS